MQSSEKVAGMTTTILVAACPFCAAPAGTGCVNPLTGLPVGWPHLERTRAAS